MNINYTIFSPFSHFGIIDALEILIFIFVSYKLIKALKNSREAILLKGIGVLLIMYLIAYLCSFNAILYIFQICIPVFAIGIIIVFQPELRKALERIGTIDMKHGISFGNLLKTIIKNDKKKESYYSETTINEICKSVFDMGKAKTGAIIVIEKDIPLIDYAKTGIKLDSDISSALLINIFEKNTPLHDGAVIVKKNKIEAATCYLPLSYNKQINKKYGTRHRAALGMSETTDAIIIVVSEETGDVSVCIDGKLKKVKNENDFIEIMNNNQYKKEMVQINIGNEEYRENKWTFESIKNRFNSRTFRKEFLLKCLSVIVGLFAWIMIITITDPIEVVTFPNIPVEIINENVLKDSGNTYSIISENVVTVKVKDKKSILNNINKEDIKVTADLGKLSCVNAVQAEISINGNKTSELSFNGTGVMQFNIEDIVSKEVPVEIKCIGKPSNNCYLKELIPETNTVLVYAAKSKISTVDKVMLEYDISGINSDYEGYADVVAYDKNGEKINPEQIEFNIDKIKATAKAYKTKVIPVELYISNKTYGDYVLSEIIHEPSSITIAGTSMQLDGIDKLRIPVTIDIDQSLLILCQNRRFIGGYGTGTALALVSFEPVLYSVSGAGWFFL